MSAAFTPERLGGPTTVSFAFVIRQGAGGLSPLTGVELAYPRNLGLATSGLGLSACPPVVLEVHGPGACPANSRMGSGDATVEIAFGPNTVRERVALALIAGPSDDGFLHVLVYASGKYPVEAHVVIAAVVLAGRMQIAVPQIPSLPAAPYVAVTQMRIKLGGALTYYETNRGRRVAYHPTGIGLPPRCPLGGFRFAATFSLLDGERVPSHALVACPKRR